jgi:hypothetical protein
METPHARVMLVCALVLASVFLPGCQREAARQPAETPGGGSGDPRVCAPGPGACGAGTAGAASQGSAPKKGRVARLVFIDLEKSCPCTTRRIASSWKALAAVLGSPSSIPLERYHLDTQDAKAEPFLDKRPLVAAPGLYVLDQGGNIIDLLQGEITEAQIRGAIR